VIEAVIFDYGGVISSPLFRGLLVFEETMGYPPGSLVRLLFGDGDYLSLGVPNGAGGDPVDGAADPDNPVSHHWHRLEVGEITLEDYLNGVMKDAPAVLGQPVDLAAYHKFTTHMPIGIHWMVVHKIRDLRAAGLRTALLTNNVAEFGDAWRGTFPVDDLFELVVDSSSVGIRKPDPRIYHLTAQRLGLAPEVCVFIDDNRDNVEAARAVGMHAVHFTDDDPRPALAALDEVLARVGTRPTA
jgi:putative hydrolase of the HAD superfamily